MSAPKAALWKNMPSFMRPPPDAILPRNQGNIPNSGARNIYSVPRNARQPSSASTSYGQNYNSQNFQGPARRDWQPSWGWKGKRQGWKRQRPGQSTEKKFYSTERAKTYTKTDDGYSTRTNLENLEKPKETQFHVNSIKFLLTDHTGTLLETYFFDFCLYSTRLDEKEKCTENIFLFEDTKLNQFYGQYFGVVNLSNYSILFEELKI